MRVFTASNVLLPAGKLRPVPYLRPRLQQSARTQYMNRSFHATPARAFGVDGACSSVYGAIDLLHSSTGLPWALTLPLTAVIVRTFFVLPISLWGQQHRNKIMLVNPLVHAWKPALQKQIMETDGHLGPHACQRLLVRAVRAKRKEIYKSFGLKLWPSYHSLLQLPLWLLCIETIRKMCGMPEGLLGLITKSLTFKDVETGMSTAGSGVPLVSSLETEGALWFQNLLVPDPQLILPFMLSAVMFISVRMGQRELIAQGVKMTKFRTRLTRVLMILALAIGPATLHVPSAMLIYWIASTTSAIAQRKLVDRVLPTPLTATPCEPRPTLRR